MVMPDNSIKCIIAGMGQLEELGELFDLYRQFYGKTSDLPAAIKYLNERIQNKESILFLAYSEDSPAGFAQLYPGFSSVSMKKIYILNDLYVKKEFRKTGIARILMQRICEYAKEKGRCRVTLETAQDNHPAINLYESFHFEKSPFLIFEKEI